MSWKRFHATSGFPCWLSASSMLAFSQFWVILAVWARKSFSTPAKRLMLCRHILWLKMGFLHYIILEMGSFPMSVANNFCDQPLSKYLDSKTVLIYCPHPVYNRELAYHRHTGHVPVLYTDTEVLI